MIVKIIACVCYVSCSFVFGLMADYIQIGIGLALVPGFFDPTLPRRCDSFERGIYPRARKDMTTHLDDPLTFDFMINSGHIDFTPNEIEKEELTNYLALSLSMFLLILILIKRGSFILN